MNNWTQLAIFYHIYPLGFCGAPQFHQEVHSHDILKLKDWIPHLKNMHVNAIYLGPVFESYEHGYDTSDYQLIDHRLGSNQDFKDVCDELHAAGIRIVLDGVFNHVGRNFWAFKDVQEKHEASPYCSWFHNLRFHQSNPCGDPFTYDTWEGHYNLIKLNLSNDDVVRYLLESVQMWMDEFHIDGLRLDAADCIDQNFFRRLKTYCKEQNPDFWLMGEIIHGDYTRWANPEMLDSVTNYECYKGLFSSHNEKNYFEIAHSIQRQFGKGGLYKDLVLYNFVDNHDVNRLASVLKEKQDRYNIYTLLYTMPGIPSIYYGSEWAIEGIKHNGSDADIRPCLSIQDMMKQDQSLVKHIAKLGEIKRQLSCLTNGDYEQVLVRNQQYVFARRNDHQTAYIALNVSDEPYALDINITAKNVKDLLEDTIYPCEQDQLHITMKPKQAYIFLETSQDSLKQPTPQVEESIVIADVVSETVAKKTTDSPNTTIDLKQPEQILPCVNDELELGKYRHYKGKNYTLLYIGTHSETNERYAIYREAYGQGNVWVRPLSMFQEEVDYEGNRVKRFTFIHK